LGNPDDSVMVWTDYMRYRAESRGFELPKIENIIRYSGERYSDTVTNRWVVVGWHDKNLVLIPYETKGNTIKPVTIHSTTRQQINFRLKSGRFRYE
jgi:hypothetical protein